jgi:hypothetical protein
MLRILRLLGTSLAVVACASSVAPAPAPAAATQAHFTSPSGNINCYLFAADGGAADCMVRTAGWPSTAKKPASCTLDWAPNEVQLVRSHVSIGGCRGDVGPLCLAGNGRCSTLAYGHAVTIGTIRCSSATSGVTCRRTTGSRPGFRVARERVVVYR